MSLVERKPKQAGLYLVGKPFQRPELTDWDHMQSLPRQGTTRQWVYTMHATLTVASNHLANIKPETGEFAVASDVAKTIVFDVSHLP